MKRAIVCGASGLIGMHLVARLKAEGYYVIGLSRSKPKYHFGEPADEFWTCDLRENQMQFFDKVDWVFQLACEVGGLGYIMDRANDADCLRNSTEIDISVLEACRSNKVGKVFFASSACVYPHLDRPLRESHAYPAFPLNEFAWQKIFAERLYQSYAHNYGMNIRIGRLFNTYGPGMTWQGGREKSVAALCRKIAELGKGKKLEVWGDGSQTRSYTHVDDTVEGIIRLMKSACTAPLNIGSDEGCTIQGLVAYAAKASGKIFDVSYVPGPVGNPSIVCDTQLLRQKLGWVPRISVREGINRVYPWVEAQVDMERISA